MDWGQESPLVIRTQASRNFFWRKKKDLLILNPVLELMSMIAHSANPDWLIHWLIDPFIHLHTRKLTANKFFTAFKDFWGLRKSCVTWFWFFARAIVRTWRNCPKFIEMESTCVIYSISKPNRPKAFKS